MFYKRFRTVKPLHMQDNVLPVNTEITVYGDIIYVNGGQIMPVYYNFFYNIINDELKNKTGENLREVPIPHNKC